MRSQVMCNMPNLTMPKTPLCCTQLICVKERYFKSPYFKKLRVYFCLYHSIIPCPYSNDDDIELYRIYTFEELKSCGLSYTKYVGIVLTLSEILHHFKVVRSTSGVVDMDGLLKWIDETAGSAWS